MKVGGECIVTCEDRTPVESSATGGTLANVETIWKESEIYARCENGEPYASARLIS